MNPKNTARYVILVGLILMAVAFTMLDRGWLKDAVEPLGPIDHPVAAGIGLAGLCFCLWGAKLIRRRLNGG